MHNKYVYSQKGNKTGISTIGSKSKIIHPVHGRKTSKIDLSGLPLHNAILHGTIEFKLKLWNWNLNPIMI